MVVIYHWNTPLPKVRKGLDGYKFSLSGLDSSVVILSPKELACCDSDIINDCSVYQLANLKNRFVKKKSACSFTMNSYEQTHTTPINTQGRPYL
jgi:hypothetical protein